MFHNLLVILSVLTLAGCGSSLFGSNLQNESITPKTQMSVALPKDTIEKIGDFSAASSNSKLAFFEARRPKDGEAIGGYTAALSGKLRVEENCVVIVLENGSAVQPIFASYTVVWNNTQNVLIYNSKQYRDGDYISLGGGVIPTTIADTLTKRTIPNCPDSILFLVTG